MMYGSKILLAAVVIAVVVYFLTTTGTQKMATSLQPSTATSDSIKNKSDLNQAQDQLEAVNIDGVDSGLNQLNAEANNF